MWSLRMRAAKIENDAEEHISGAEGIYNFSEVERLLKKFFQRAIKHSNGMPDKVILTIEKIKEPIHEIKALPVKTIFCSSPDDAQNISRQYLINLGISEKAIVTAWNVIKNHKMRGATLIDAFTGERLEPDKKRGVRVSRIQMATKKRLQILRKIKKFTTEPERVIEAVTVASKVISFSKIIAEICVSDNPDYTTGYIASKESGYLRLLNIKNKGEHIGGRAFFVKNPVDLNKMIEFLERTPVIII